MSKEDVLDKIRKLLRLASNNPSAMEAQAAAAKAQEMMDAHKIAEAEISTEESAEAVLGLYDHEPIVSGGRTSTWKGRLLMAISRNNACRAVRCLGSKSSLRLIGTRTNVEFCRWLFEYVAPQVDRLTLAALRSPRAIYGEPRSEARVWANNFRLGLVEGVGKRLDEARRQAQEAAREHGATGSALMVLDREAQALAEFLKDQKFKRVTAYTRGDAGARAAGMAASSKVVMNRPLRGNTRGLLGS